MKRNKILAALLALCMMLGLAACGGQQTAEPAAQTVPTEDYLGISVGYGYAGEESKTDGGATRNDEISQLAITISDYTFLDDGSAVGLYLEAGILIRLNFDTKINGIVVDYIEPPIILADVAVGPGFRFDLTRDTDILLSAGVDLSYIDETTRYQEGPTFYEVTRSLMTLGLYANADVKYNFTRKFFMTIGFKGTFNFLSWMLKESSAYAGWNESHTSETKGVEGFIRYRVSVKVLSPIFSIPQSSPILLRYRMRTP